MESKSTVVDMMTSALTKIREMVEVDTIVGQPITTPDGTTIIPVSRVSFGFGAGGSDWSTKVNFVGGSGAGVTVAPISFLVVTQDGVRLIPVTTDSETSLVEKIVDAVPSIIERVEDMIKKYKK